METLKSRIANSSITNNMIQLLEMADSRVECLGCHHELVEDIWHSPVSRTLILCEPCKKLFQEMDRSNHLFLNTYSKEAFLALDRSELETVSHGKLMTEPLLRELITKENEWRLADSTQKLFAEMEHTSYIDWIDVVTAHQGEMMNEAGFTEERNEAALNVFRRARHIFPDDPFYTTPIYIKYNRAGHCLLDVGEKVPEMMLHQEDATPMKMSTLLADPKPTLIVAGSYT